MRDLTIEFTVRVKVKARDEVARRGHWTKPIEIARAEDWVMEDVAPPSDARIIHEVRARLNDQTYGVSAADFRFEVERYVGGKVKP